MSYPKRIIYVTLFFFAALLASAFLRQPAVPEKLIGKWKLRGNDSKLVGNFEISAAGKFTYLILPNYKKTGNVSFNRSKTNWIDLVMIQKIRKDTIRGIFNIEGNQLKLCLGKTNGTRPAAYINKPVENIIYWIGTK